jgi:hypothetical protein
MCDSDLFIHVFKTTNKTQLSTFMSCPIYLVAETPKTVILNLYVNLLIDPSTRVDAFYHVYLTPHTMCTLHHVYKSSLHLSMVLSHEITPDPIEPRHCILDSWSSHTTYGHPPSQYVLTPHSFYNYIRIRIHHVSNQHVTVISPDHRYAHISCCIVRVISTRSLLCALAEHTEATFSPPTCASIVIPIV